MPNAAQRRAWYFGNMRTGAVLLFACGWLAGCDESLLDQLTGGGGSTLATSGDPRLRFGGCAVENVSILVTGGLVTAH